MLRSLVGSEMCIRDRYQRRVRDQPTTAMSVPLLVLGFVPAVLVVMAVVFNMKAISAMAQQGSLQARDDFNADPRKNRLKMATAAVSLEQRLTFCFGTANVALTLSLIHI
eukprot:TRINITY_DN52835_c0_g1_i1.p4 TRINITY_DN52835_c0_g1~~TRINITY_DN52835_c0_g1_i1.p4  ORF type:complete len:110 (-),score=39.79 TRINITY_DN52835_c0_g1_i1:75-404(-)